MICENVEKGLDIQWVLRLWSNKRKTIKIKYIGF